jgi:uncharacterized membrane protein
MIIEESVEICAAADRVWETVIDLPCWSRWNGVLRDLNYGDRPRIAVGGGFSCTIRFFGIPVSFAAKVLEVTRGERIIWESRKFGISAIHEFLFHEEPGAVRVSSRETFSGPPIHYAKVLFPAREVRILTIALLQDLKEAAERNHREVRSN